MCESCALCVEYVKTLETASLVAYYTLPGMLLVLLKIRDEGLAGGFVFLGEALQIIEVHPAEDGIVFLVGDPAVQRGGQAGHGGVLPHEAYQNFPRGKGFTDPI